ncbi:PAS domain S-box protein [Methylobacterium sp. PvR107]|uniref:PAS domain S-box protein n=1 Tax=Methylobacterium sp. PvR107 TaxID=2806597 RepID=UPI001AE264DC|nr:PAS domain S-box protein [Methylobacterium sp. PvR107]MBP1178326.1 PAS domain S-box-containing protein [Methylobacterium sp. PvR107]
MPNVEQMMKRQQMLADFGEFALGSESLDAVLAEACRLVGEALGTGRAKILEIQEDQRCLLVRAGVGWDFGIVGLLRLPLDEHSSETFAISEGKPVITRDIRKEERFDVPAFMRNAGVVALANVPIFVPGKKPYGLLQVDATEPRDFGHADTEFLRTYATILGPVIDRLHKVDVLRVTEERFRLVVENARDYGIFLTDSEDRITDWYPGAEAVYGWTAGEAIGQPASIIFTPEDRRHRADEKELEEARREGSAPDIRWHRRKDGARVFIEGMTTSLRDADGSLRGFLKIGQDVTERRKSDEALRDSEVRFRAVASLVPVLLWRSDAGGTHNSANQPWLDYTGQSLEQSQSSGWLDAIHPDDQAITREAFRTGHAERKLVEVQLRIRARDGLYRWFLVRQTPITDARGQLVKWFGAAMDIDELRNAQARQEVLVRELQHRSRNLLGVVTALAQRTVGQGAPLESFTTRLQALSRAQSLLSQSGSDMVEVGALVDAELAAHAGSTPTRITIAGPKVRLTSQQVQNFALALHELTTNAVKYGALRSDTGRLSVTWERLRGDEGKDRLALSWIESGVDVQPETVTRHGYGRELIERALTYALQARTEYRLGADGVRCRIEMPLA